MNEAYMGPLELGCRCPRRLLGSRGFVIVFAFLGRM